MEALTSDSVRWRLLRPLLVSNYRWLWIGESISILGSQLQMLAIPWLVLSLTGSSRMLGGVFMSAALPCVFFSLYGGVLADRFSPRLIMLVANVTRAFLSFGVIVFVLNHRSMISLYLFVVLIGVCDALFYPAYYAIVPKIMDPDRLSAGMALMQVSNRVAGIVGPSAAGMIIAFGGLAWPFCLNALSFMIAGVFLLLVKMPKPTLSTTKAPVGRSLAKEGYDYVKRDKALRAMIVAGAILNFAVTGPFFVALPLIATSSPRAAVQLGTMYSCLSGGGLLGSLYAGRRSSFRNRGILAVICMFVVGVALVGVAMSEVVEVRCISIIILSFTTGILNLVVVTWLQARTDSEMQGRVMGFFSLSVQGTLPLSFGIAGLIGQFGATKLLVGSGSVTLIAALCLLGNKNLRSID